MRKIWIIIIFLITGCASIGPRSICLDRERYNDVIRDTNNVQILTNIVRLRYVEPTFFFRLDSVTSSFSLEPAINRNIFDPFAGVTWLKGTDPFVQRTANITPSVLYADRPTIRYLPIDDQQFAESIMKPIPLERVRLLFAGGVDDPLLLMRLIVQSINELDNASAASSAKLARLPRYQEYYQFLGLLSKLYREGTCGLYPEKDKNGNYTIAIHFNKCCINSPTALAIKKMLNVPLDAADILFTDKIKACQPNSVYVRTRSIYGILTYLSYSIQMPAEDYRKHLVYQYHYPDGTPFDWLPLMRELMTIYSSDCPPCDAFVKAFVHGHWFYVKNSDPDSKSTFTLLVRLGALAIPMQNEQSFEGNFYNKENPEKFPGATVSPSQGNPLLGTFGQVQEETIGARSRPGAR